MRPDPAPMQSGPAHVSKMASSDDRTKLAIGRRIRAARLARGFSQKALARQIGREPVVLWKNEKGVTQPNTDALMKLAVALNVSVDWLFHGGDGGPVPDPELKLRAAVDGQPNEVPFVVAELLAGQRLGMVTAEEIAFLARLVTIESMNDIDDLEVSLLARRAASTRSPADVAAFNTALDRQSKERSERTFSLVDDPEPPPAEPVLKSPKRTEPKEPRKRR